MLKLNNNLMGDLRVSMPKERATLNKAYPKPIAFTTIATREEQLKNSKITILFLRINVRLRNHSSTSTTKQSKTNRNHMTTYQK